VASTGDSGIKIQPGMDQYMQNASAACYILIRNADDPIAAERALSQFRDDLYDSDVFSALDGEFGEDVDGSVLRYTPSSSDDVEMTPDGPILRFDADSTLDDFPNVVPTLLARLRWRLSEAGVVRAEIGWPPGSYGDL